MQAGSRARELLPSILLTLLSVVQALALESAWSSVREMHFLYEGGTAAWIGWLQTSSVFLGIVVVWLFYIGIVMRFSWIPATRDSVAPFVLGAGELALIQLMERRHLAGWFLVLAAIFAFSTWISNRMFLAGRADPENAGISELLTRDNELERRAPAIFVSTLLLMGLAVWLAGEDGAVAIACVAVANGLLLLQAAMIQRYWWRWISGVYRDTDADAETDDG